MVVPISTDRFSSVKSSMGDLSAPSDGAVGGAGVAVETGPVKATDTAVADGLGSMTAGRGGVDAPSAPSAATVTVAFIDDGWIAQKYWNVPTSVNVNAKDAPSARGGCPRTLPCFPENRMWKCGEQSLGWSTRLACRPRQSGLPG